MQKINFKNLPDTSTPLSAENLNLLQDNIETAINSIELSGGGDEVGTVKMFSGSTAPQGWLICDGSAISRTEYAELFSAIGTTYGSGNGTTTFNIPNIKGRTVVGLDSNDTDFDTLGKIGGSKELQEHTHNNRMDTLNNLDQNYGLSSNGVYADRVVIRSNNINSNTLYNEKNIQDAGTGNSGNLQPYIVLNYIIKASATTTTQGQIIDSLDGSSTTDAPSVHAVNTALTYTKLGTITGDSTINLPNTWKELYAVIDLNGQKYQFTILKQLLDDYTGSSDFSFRHGAYLTTGTNQGCSIYINNSKTIIRINEAYQSGSDIKSSAILTVFYK